MAPQRIVSLEPGLVVAVMEENARENVEELREAGAPVFLGAPETVEEATAMLRELAERVGAPRAESVLRRIESTTSRLRDASRGRAPRRVFVPIWKTRT